MRYSWRTCYLKIPEAVRCTITDAKREQRTEAELITNAVGITVPKVTEEGINIPEEPEVVRAGVAAVEVTAEVTELLLTRATRLLTRVTTLITRVTEEVKVEVKEVDKEEDKVDLVGQVVDPEGGQVVDQGEEEEDLVEEVDKEVDKVEVKGEVKAEV